MRKAVDAMRHMQTALIDMRDDGKDVAVYRYLEYDTLKDHLDRLRRDGYRARVRSVSLREIR